MKQRFLDKTEEEFKAAADFKPLASNTRNENYLGSRSLTHKWKDMEFSDRGKELGPTGIDRARLDKLVEASVHLPGDSFNPHERLTRTHIGARLKSHKDDSIDWATAEALAFGSLLQDGYNVRLSGEDVERGTFSHRHIKLTCQTTETKHIPLLQSDYMQQTATGRLSVNNSNLAENGPMAYEVGYSLESPKNLSLWEAQYGDFYNPA